MQSRRPNNRFEEATAQNETAASASENVKAKDGAERCKESRVH
jgi:hypothetical protein